MRRSIAGVILLAVLAGFADPAPLERAGRLVDPAIVEASGIVRSRKHPGIFWVHNDSGNPSALFAVRRDGSPVRSYRVAALNVDWEDIALDDEGHLYLGDIGNNKLRLGVRAIHRFDEPDPSGPSDAPLVPTASLFYGFPESGRFDAEGLFLRDGRPTVVTKRFDGREAELYRLDFRARGSPLRPALPERVGTLPGCKEPATGADLSPDGKLLAVSTDTAARVYEPDGPAGWKLRATVRHRERDIEAICWDGLDLILASEDRSIYRVAEATWEASAGDAR